MSNAGSGIGEAALAFLIRILSAGLVFGLQILLARLMPLEGYGGFVTLWTWMLALGSFGALGLAEASVRFVPRYAERGRDRQVAGFWRFGLGTVIGGSLILGGAGVMTGWAMGPGAEPGLIVLLVGLGLPFLALEYYLEGIARSFGWYRLTTVPVYIVRPVLIGGSCFLLHLSGVRLDLAVVGSVVIGAMAVVAIGVGVLLAHRLRRFARQRPVGPGQKRLWLRAALPLLVISGLDDLVAYADVLVVSLLLPAEEVGLYFAAARTLALAGFVTYALYLVSGRRFALDLAGRSRAELQNSVRETSRLTFWATLIAVTGTLAAGPLLLGAFGPEFTAGYGVMIILGVGMVLRALSGQAGEVLIVAGRQRAGLYVGLGALLGSVTLCLVLVPVLGLVGAALATALTMAGRALALAVVLKRLEGLDVVSVGLPRLRRPG